eukprot:TRINITY_DN17993_c0_g1_i1.p1 TRINITY_DN17993_c0_g1~~TRINITY_DN17993_c0_g1_i1.p1  ORF type:complete len:1588 (+),score=432.64 TRINITY_DN17993_c0_g1_i1:391-4764(+)
MEDVAAQCHLAGADAVVAEHTSYTYRVYFLGFMGGFPYLGGLKGPLAAVPRKKTPAACIAKGSVAVAGGQTGVYSISSPGGWNIIGRTDADIFNPARDPPAMLRPGDLVKFAPVAELAAATPAVPAATPPAEAAWMTVTAPGMLTTVQDPGRFGAARYGVSRAGAADPLALSMGNALVGNAPSAAALEVTMGGLEFTVIRDAVVALTGADCNATVAGAPLPRNRCYTVKAGEAVKLGYATHGMRAYVCVRGGFDVPEVLGSTSTDLRSAMGGYCRRVLQAGDALARHEDVAPPAESFGDVRYARYDPLEEAAGRVWEVRVLPGPGAPAGGREAPACDVDFRALIGAEYSVLPKSDRMAVCLSAAGSGGVVVEGGQQMSEGCVTGTVQVPPDGNPLILLAEHQTTGGYKVPAVVVQADLWKVGQMRPGDVMKFVPTTPADAVAALRALRAGAAETCLAPPQRFQDLPFRPRTGDALRRIDLNADAGEGYDDAGLLQYVTSVNIACGGHVGSPESVARTVALAVAAGAGIGAHPSYVDPANFGRKALDVPPATLRDQVLWQVSGLQAVCAAYGTAVRYIKPHGALYHAVLKGGPHGDAVLDAAHRLGLPLLLMPTSSWATYGEGFAERAYDGDKLRPRDKPGAVIHDPALAAQQAVALAARPGVHSICVHGDSPNAVSVARAVRAALEAEFTVAPFAPARTASSASADSAATRQARMNWFLGPEGRRAVYTPAPGAGAPWAAAVAKVIVNGYRRGDGVDPERYPTERVCRRVAEVQRSLEVERPPLTAFAEYASGATDYDGYIAALRKQLAAQGGGWVAVAPRDTCQQGFDSESAAITYVSRLNCERWGVRAGCVGYEIGGAQYQAGLIRGFDPGRIAALGLPDNLPAHSLQRAQYVNGLAELSSGTRRALFAATAEFVARRYGRSASSEVPWLPYNFHAGNYVDDSTGRSPLDETTGELLNAGCTPMPVWVFSSHFPISALRAWTKRQIEMFRAAGRQLHCVRIKNPGHGAAWTAEAVWDHVAAVLAVFEDGGLAPPIVYVHNHDFNGLGAHVGAALFRTAREHGFPNLVLDAGYRKNGTHNDALVMLSALTLTDEQQAALREWSAVQADIEKILTRFDSRDSQMTPWDSDWAGGTEGSDLRIAREYNLTATQINTAKEVASAVFPLERAVTPFSEYKLRLGIGIMIETGIEPKNPEAVKAWVHAGGKLQVGGPVLVGLARWETLVPKPPEVDALLRNMHAELAAAQAQCSGEVPLDSVEPNTPEACFAALGFQQKGVRFLQQVKGTDGDMSVLLRAPGVLHRRGKTLPPGTAFDVLREDGEATRVVFDGYTFPGADPGAEGGEVEVRLTVDGRQTAVRMALSSMDAEEDERKTAAAGDCAVASDIPGELVRYTVAPGDVLKAGETLCVVESMKMEYVVPVPQRADGRAVDALPLRVRSVDRAGDVIRPGDVLVELVP